MALLEAQLKLIGAGENDEALTVPPGGLRVGRGSGNDYVLNVNQVSKQHLRFFWGDDTLLLEDMESTNGTFVNEQRLPAHDPFPLNPGDVIRIGIVYFLVEIIRQVEPVLEPVSAPGSSLGNEVNEQVLEALLAPHYPTNLTAVELERVMDIMSQIGDKEVGIPSPEEGSSWMKYLPPIFTDPELANETPDATNFVGRFLLIFEAILAPITWTIDNFDQFLSPEIAPEDWLEWFARWFDIMLLPQLPLERKRAIVAEIASLTFQRGTPSGLERLLELSFGVKPEIIEHYETYSFTVRLSREAVETVGIDTEGVERLIASQTPAFAAFKLELIEPT